MPQCTDFVDVNCAKNRLQEYCQRHYIPLPVYTLLEKAGADHSPMFQVEVEVNGMIYTGEWAPKKRDAEKLAALEAWISIHRPPSPIKTTHTCETNDPCVLLEKINLEEEQNIESMESKIVANKDVEPPFHTKRVPMRDGVELVVDYFLASPTSKYPAIIEITPYGRILERPNFRNEARYWISHGYAFVIADVRGTGDSEGEFQFFLNDGKDGYDLIEWIARQSWSNGRVGMRGGSYSGGNQWYTARERPPHLSCITPNTSPGGPMDGVPYHNGVFALLWSLNWIGSSLDIARSPAVNPHPNPMTWLNHRPLHTLDVYATGRELPLYRTFLGHPTLDDFWHLIDFTATDFEVITIPTLAFTGWFDSTLTGTVEHYQGARRFSSRKADHFLFIGPYSHGTAPDGGYDYMTNEPVPTVGDIEVPDDGLLPARDMTRQFYEWCLKDKPRPEWKPIRIFVTGSNKWMTLNIFPPENAYEKFIFLTSEGHANSISGDGRLQWTPPITSMTDHYLYDPTNPLMIDMTKKQYELPVDMNDLLDRNDILVYTSEILNSSLTVIGNVIFELTFSSTAQDTDLVIHMIDVMPDGRSIKLGSGFSSPLRLRYREGLDREVLMVPGSIYFVKIDLNEIGHTFMPLHRIRMTITSSFYPWHSVNPNTGGPIATDIQPSIVANQTIHHIPSQPSRIRMMVVENPVFDP
ncbi:unnamed protein product [Rotaria magnacalcarata]|uniref:DRBM domain-containing protein n=8 Tax=Rotaria magnacalcarata TaxID=392030 RepID=A0A816PYD9_9BILA|nr:unnamed protein product [Rotaria magnacalcarata]CAF2053138.1 unnamed protein product [Rotaria magnacalcarata]CAF4080272.1 unnamed protein product [Rotaria magnacalcarata]